MVKLKRWGIPFCDTSRGMVWITAKSKKEALEMFEADNFDGNFDMDYCGDQDVEFEPENIEEG